MGSKVPCLHPQDSPNRKKSNDLRELPKKSYQEEIKQKKMSVSVNKGLDIKNKENENSNEQAKVILEDEKLESFKEKNKQILLEKEREEKELEKEKNKNLSVGLKEEGNKFYAIKDYGKAIEKYSQAIVEIKVF